MTDVLVQVTVGNLVASGVLAGIAWAVHRHGRYPGLAHVLWVLVLLKLVTPPLLFVPLPSSYGLPTSALTTTEAGPALAAAWSWVGHHGLSLFLLVWLVGSLLVLGISVLRIGRFDRLLRDSSVEAPGDVQAMAAELARELGMGSAPPVFLTEAAVSPMTWWAGRRVRVVLPTTLQRQMTTAELRLILAHELAHVRRRDHLVRWLEWLACVSFWWNPIAWWARQNLHQDEEASCDALVVGRLGAKPRSYARALLRVVELLARPAVRPPAVATGIDGARSLERRFALLITDGHVRRAPRHLAGSVLAIAVLVLPLGLGHGVRPAGDTSTTGPVPPSAAAIGRAAVGMVPEPAAVEYGYLSAMIADESDLRRRLTDARSAVREARQATRSADASKGSWRELRQARRELREARRAWRESGASD